MVSVSRPSLATSDYLERSDFARVLAVVLVVDVVFEKGLNTVIGNGQRRISNGFGKNRHPVATYQKLFGEDFGDTGIPTNAKASSALLSIPWTNFEQRTYRIQD